MIHIVLNAVKMLNFIPTKEGISNTLSPKTIMSERLLTTRNTWVSKLDNTVRCTRKIPCAIVKVQELRVPSCLDPVVVTSKEDTSSWLWISEIKLLTEAEMWFPCWIQPLLAWMHWEMTNQKNSFLPIDADARLEMLKSQEWWILKKKKMRMMLKY
jgi:hypothetical protein